MSLEFIISTSAYHFITGANVITTTNYGNAVQGQLWEPQPKSKILVHDKVVKKKDLSLVYSGLWLHLYKHQVHSPLLFVSVASRNQSPSCGGKDSFDLQQQPSSLVMSHYCTWNSQLMTEDAAAAVASVSDVSWDLLQTKRSLHLKKKVYTKSSSRLHHHHQIVTHIVTLFIRNLVDSITSFGWGPKLIIINLAII